MTENSRVDTVVEHSSTQKMALLKDETTVSKSPWIGSEEVEEAKVHTRERERQRRTKKAGENR